MILLPIKRTEEIDLFNPILRVMKGTSGPEVKPQAKSVLQRLQVLRKELANISHIGDNATLVKKVEEEIKEYLSMWNCILRCFTFGEDKESVNVCFEWYDAYTNDKRKSSNPIIERIGMLYNLGVVYNQIGVNLVNSPEDKIKEAANIFLTAAWIFDRIKLDLVNLQIKELSSDLSESSLSMCSYLMKAQAQSCAYERVRSTREDKPDLIAKLAMQACKDYEVANGYSRTLGISRTANGKDMATIMQFKEDAFRSRAYYWSAIEFKKRCEQTTVGMGKAAANIRKALECVNVMKLKEKNYTGKLMEEYKALHTQCTSMQKDIDNQNYRYYHESVPPHPTEIDPMPYGKPISIEAELERPFDGRDNFSLKVPPGVKMLANEYKKGVEMIVQEALGIAKEMEEWRIQLLKKYNLPSSIHAVSNEQKISNNIWQRIKKCKEVGGLRGLNHMLYGVEELSKSNEINILKIHNQLKEEEKEDAEMRQKYESKWTRVASKGLNTNMLKQLEHLKQKLDQGKESDIKIKNFVLNMKEPFELLELDRDTLTSKIPKGGQGTGKISPTATKYIYYQL